jgi:hypothetical protein
VGDVEVLIAMTLHALPVAGADVAVEGRPAMENVVGVIELGLLPSNAAPAFSHRDSQTFFSFEIPASHLQFNKI